MAVLYTIGHSNRSLEEFIAILKAQEITHLVDVRTIPRSRHVPWFNKGSLAKALKKANIHYQHFPILGGMRHPVKHSQNTAWRNTGFRGFADYMQTPAFFSGLKKLNALLKKSRKIAVMCAEAVPWRCHRSLIADAEIIRKIKVLDILSKHSVKEHQLTKFAIVDRTKKPMQIIYPTESNLEMDI